MEDLERDPRTAALEGQAGHGRGEAASGALPADREPVTVPALLGAVLGDPADHLVRLVRRGREGVLRRDDVVDVDHRHPCLGREVAAQRVVELGRRQDVAAAVEVDVDRRGAVGRRQVDHGGSRCRRTSGSLSSRVVARQLRPTRVGGRRGASRAEADGALHRPGGQRRHPRVGRGATCGLRSLRQGQRQRRGRAAGPGGDPRDAGRDRPSVGLLGGAEEHVAVVEDAVHLRRRRAGTARTRPCGSRTSGRRRRGSAPRASSRRCRTVVSTWRCGTRDHELLGLEPAAAAEGLEAQVDRRQARRSPTPGVRRPSAGSARTCRARWPRPAGAGRSSPPARPRPAASARRRRGRPAGHRGGRPARRRTPSARGCGRRRRACSRHPTPRSTRAIAATAVMPMPPASSTCRGAATLSGKFCSGCVTWSSSPGASECMKAEPPRDCGTRSTLMVSSDPVVVGLDDGVGPDVGRVADRHAYVEVAARRRPAACGALDRDPLDVLRHRGGGDDPAGAPVGLGAGGHRRPTRPAVRLSASSIRSRIRRTHMPPASMLRL